MVEKNYLGYPVDIMGVVGYALTNIPQFRSLMQSEPFDIWEIKVFRAVTGILGNQAGIPDLGIITIWIGGGKKGSCWYLPSRFRQEKLRDEDAEALKTLQELLEMEEPILFTHYDQPEPDYMKRIDMTNMEQYCLSDVMEAFQLDGKGIIDRLLSGVNPGIAMKLRR